MPGRKSPDNKITLQAPAKVNLTLKVLGRRPDGYHDLEMEMVKLDLCDEIEFEIVEIFEIWGVGTRLESDDPHLPVDSSNMIWRAADLVRERSGRRFGLRARIKKRIPVAAGLGGGSSDAAATLIALNDLLKLRWGRRALQEIGLQLGADVPFFLTEGPQRAKGTGEKLTPLANLPPLWLILVNPGFPLATNDVYRWFDDQGSTLSRQSRLTGRGGGARHPPLENDLEQVVIPRYPVLGRMKGLLGEAGALGMLMSGSGPTVFGLFDSAASRDRGYETVLQKKDPGWWICKSASLNSGVV